MQVTQTLLLLLFSAVPALAVPNADRVQPLEPRNPKPTGLCSQKDIESRSILNCDCRGKSTKCKVSCPTDKQTCTTTYTPDKFVNKCDDGCVQSEADCKGCGLYYHSLCDCLKDPKNPKICTTNKPPSSGPIWAHLKTGGNEHDLYTTTEVIPGILEMAAPPYDFHNEGWLFAQDEWTKDEALAMNPWIVRTEEQVHIHLCEAQGLTKAVLTKEDIASEKHLVKLKAPGSPQFQSLYCMGRKNTNDKIDNFMEALNEFRNEHKDVCPQEIGAGMMRDNNGRPWACATTSYHGPLPYFCVN